MTVAASYKTSLIPCNAAYARLKFWDWSLENSFTMATGFLKI